MPLKSTIAIADAIVRLLQPLAEIVIHEIKTNTIVYINGALSARSVGDPSLLETEKLDEIDNVVYSKMNFDGKLVKSTSVLLENKWLVCLNLDVSVFNQMQAMSNLLLQNMNSAQPKSLFTNDWQQKLHLSVHDYLRAKQWSFEQLSNAQKKMLVTHLFDLDAFNEKNAADYVAKVLTLGRATVFKYLKELRQA